MRIQPANGFDPDYWKKIADLLQTAQFAHKDMEEDFNEAGIQVERILVRIEELKVSESIIQKHEDEVQRLRNEINEYKKRYETAARHRSECVTTLNRIKEFVAKA